MPDHHDDGAAYVLLPPAVRTLAEHTCQQAAAAGRTCGHPGRFCSASAPEAGLWCANCGARHLADLLLSPWCSLCPGWARPGLTAAGVGHVTVLARVCDRCLRAPA